MGGSSPTNVVAISGASSFTGLWIARELASRGFAVQALVGSSSPKRAALLEFPGITRHFGVRAEDGTMAEWVRKHEPKIWIHHHHFMQDFRSPQYDVARARQVGIEPLPELLEALSLSGCRGIIFSGSYFEDQAKTPYAITKREVWNALRAATELPLSKVVIPNPIGPLENEDRLIPQLIQRAREGTVLSLRSPSAIGDQLPVTWLARRYAELAEDLLVGRPARVVSPSGWVGPVGAWVKIVQEELIRRRLGLTPCRVEEGSESAPGFENPASERESGNWAEVWEHYKQYSAP